MLYILIQNNNVTNTTITFFLLRTIVYYIKIKLCVMI